MEQQEVIKRLERRIEELENKLHSMKLDMMIMESRQTGYRLENINNSISQSFNKIEMIDLILSFNKTNKNSK